ncbi:MAG: hypothetical protein UV58_C0001G0042 [Candidatus Wolfebacteria bacterium GW2011_GWC1_43_10]|uniref:Uncharacterized protein n=1 Tax=Candidatus Wolfebacteria bacterium GW2011_GWC1_43_10 TaxID=1619011 RepID=A0A0G1CBT4_9BACT|nr:MAG: hypothetical protein UV58_C0001G0042 [Candidatus Wolfebacteria bacterium GW2011_GWC1_43_10]
MIKGLEPRLAEAGKIKIGGLGETRKSKGGGEYRVPRKDDHFTITKTSRDDAGDLIEDAGIMDRIGPRPLTEIPIVLHSDEIDEVFPTSYAVYSGKAIACRGDGEKAERRKRKDGVDVGERESVACPCDLLRTGKCKPHGTLHCTIRVPDVAVAGAVYKWRTTSLISCQQMVGSLLQIKAACGVLQGLPLQLVLREIKVAPEGKPTTVYVCHVELRAQDVASAQRLALDAIEARERLGARVETARAQYRALLTAPESDDEIAAVEEEFYPPEADNPVVALLEAQSAPSLHEQIVRLTAKVGAERFVSACRAAGSDATKISADAPEDLLTRVLAGMRS